MVLATIDSGDHGEFLREAAPMSYGMKHLEDFEWYCSLSDEDKRYWREDMIRSGESPSFVLAEIASDWYYAKPSDERLSAYLQFAFEAEEQIYAEIEAFYP